MLRNKKILVGVTGGIAAYKIPQLVRDLKRKDAEVKVVMTGSAAEFVTPLTLSTLSQNEVVVGTFPEAENDLLKAGTWHIDLAQWADLMLIAPVTANTLAKLAHGFADNAVTILALAMRRPVLLSPSMDVDMWNHAMTRDNVSRLEQMGYLILPPAEGELASGLTGAGRLPDLPMIVESVERSVDGLNQDLTGKKILITAGPTLEPIDPVRFIGNRSSGKMGFALASAASHRGAQVTLIAGKTALATPKNVKRVDVRSAAEMHRAVMRASAGNDAVIMAAAVADYTPVKYSSEKIKKDRIGRDHLTLQLKPTKDILKDLGSAKKRSILVGFAAETEHGVGNAKKKLLAKNLDLIILNNPLEEGAGFDVDTNIATIIHRDGTVEKIPKMQKYRLAHKILERIAKLI